MRKGRSGEGEEWNEEGEEWVEKEWSWEGEGRIGKGGWSGKCTGDKGQRN